MLRQKVNNRREINWERESNWKKNHVSMKKKGPVFWCSFLLDIFTLFFIIYLEGQEMSKSSLIGITIMSVAVWSIGLPGYSSSSLVCECVCQDIPIRLCVYTCVLSKRFLVCLCVCVEIPTLI